MVRIELPAFKAHEVEHAEVDISLLSFLGQHQPRPSLFTPGECVVSRSA